MTVSNRELHGKGLPLEVVHIALREWRTVRIPDDDENALQEKLHVPVR